MVLDAIALYKRSRHLSRTSLPVYLGLTPSDLTVRTLSFGELADAGVAGADASDGARLTGATFFSTSTVVKIQLAGPRLPILVRHDNHLSKESSSQF